MCQILDEGDLGAATGQLVDHMEDPKRTPVHAHFEPPLFRAEEIRRTTDSAATLNDEG
jgi:hypothetical protein